MHIFYGGQFGLSNTSPKDELDVSDFGTLSVVADLEFGHSLAIGDFDGFKCGIASCKDDLAIGVPGFTLTASVDEGAVITIPGESIGTSSAVFDILRADNFGANIVAGDRFGSFLWAGDIDGTFPMDLAIGVPDKVPTMGGTAQGAVYLAAGQGLGTLQPMQEITQLDVVEGEGKLGLIEVLSDFGASFVAADIDGDGTPDWAIGAPRHGSGDEGRVWLLLRGGIFADGFESGDVGAWSSSAP